MLSLEGINRTMDKLNQKEIEGRVDIIEKGRPEIRYKYTYNEKTVFTFGITRSSKARNKNYGYVPRQMGIDNSFYRGLHDCPKSKLDYNKKIEDERKI